MTSIKIIQERCRQMPDQDLWDSMPVLARSERHDLAKFLIHLSEIDRRSLHVVNAYSGLYKYLRDLGYSEWESRARAVAAAQAERFPRIYSMIRTGRLNLTSLAVVGPYLTSENYRSLLAKASRRTRRELEALVAELQPQPGRRDSVRVISVGPAAEPAVPPPGPLFESDLFSAAVAVAVPSSAPPVVKRLRYSFDADETLDELLTRARDILRHKYPYGEMEHILRDALDALLERVDLERKLLRRQRRAQAARDG
jgi:hypothetical protein